MTHNKSPWKSGPRPVRNCEVCGADITVKVRSAKTCSTICSQRLHKRPRSITTKKLELQKTQFSCALCDEALNPDATFPQPDATVVDHILPRSLGGSDDMVNLQLAHNNCNMRKGNRLLDGLLTPLAKVERRAA
jgi:5-methylcytosine-specific restriction endonuclease McrA